MPSPPPPARSQRVTRSVSKHPEVSLKRKVLGLALFLILASSLLNALFGDRSLFQLIKSREELQSLEREIGALEVKNHQLLEEIRALKTSPLAVERLAREQLGMVKPGELILLIQDGGLPDQ